MAREKVLVRRTLSEAGAAGFLSMKTETPESSRTMLFAVLRHNDLSA